MNKPIVTKSKKSSVSINPAPNKSVSRKTTVSARYKRARVKTNAQPDFTFSYKSADDKNMFAIIEVVRTGISPQDFNKIIEDIPFSMAEWAKYLQLSERTIQRNQKEKKLFQPIQSERIVELTMLHKYGVEVFGDKDHFNAWLGSTSIALGGRSPKELLDTKFGITMVKDELGRIEHGILA